MREQDSPGGKVLGGRKADRKSVPLPAQPRRSHINPSSAPLEGVVVLVIDEPHAASRIEKSLASRGAAVFVAHDDDGCLRHLESIDPHFAVIDPSVTVGGPMGAA